MTKTVANHSLKTLGLGANTTCLNHHEIIWFTSSGFSHSAQWDVLICLKVRCGMVRVMPLPRCAGRASSRRAWMKRTGALMDRLRMASSSL